ncbi:MAG: hypothetical protein M3O32_21140 [Actinomycetota bacterium]|nr:hypothetical protein [Actinomycetota bacterium]MDP9168543.1 hypothetical protein [Actinomycetota bacterium]
MDGGERVAALIKEHGLARIEGTSNEQAQLWLNEHAQLWLYYCWAQVDEGARLGRTRQGDGPPDVM